MHNSIHQFKVKNGLEWCTASQSSTQSKANNCNIVFIDYGVILRNTRFAMQFKTCHTVGVMTKVRIAGGVLNPQ
jgi:hypothetical protein